MKLYIPIISTPHPPLFPTPDAFLHQVHTATEKLKNLSQLVNNVMENKVIGMINTIENFCLFDPDLAFSRTWVRT